MKQINWRFLLRLFFLALFGQTVCGFTQAFEWAKGFGGTSYDEGHSIYVDASGNVYTTGKFGGTVDFDPGAGTAFLSAVGLRDIFIQKLDVSGNFLWAKSCGGTDSDKSNSIAVDASGNVYTTGYFFDTVDFDPGVGTSNLISAGNTDIFVQKLDASGNFLWAKSFGSSSADLGTSIAVDASGSVYTIGYFSNTVDFNPGVGTANLTSSGFTDIFVQKLDASGNFLWVKSLGGTGSNRGHSIKVDATGNIYTTGSFTNIVDFDPGAGTFNLSAVGSSDIFVQKLDPSGNFLWAKAFGGTGFDVSYSIEFDVSGNLYTTGSFRNTVDFDPSPGVSTLTSAGDNDIFIQKLDALGNFLWAKTFGGTAADGGNSVAVDAAGNVYITGHFRNTVDFDPGVSLAELSSSAGTSDIFIQKLDGSGNFLWAKAFGGTDSDRGSSLAVDAADNVYTTGRFEDTVDFNPGAGTANLSDLGSGDIFVQKMSQCVPTAGTDVQMACDTFIWIDGNTYTESNSTATVTITSAGGCDSTVTLDLTINPNYQTSDTLSICKGDPYTFPDGIVFPTVITPVTYTSDLTAISGCDSSVTITLLVDSVYEARESVEVCEGTNYVLPDGTILQDITTQQVYTSVLPTSQGCDSTITTQISVVSVEAELLLINDTLKASLDDAQYQWVDCVTGQPIIGETNQTFFPTQSGEYAVAVTQNGCTDTSTCYSSQVTTLEEEKMGQRFTVSPNPFYQDILIRSSGLATDLYIRLISPQGKMITDQYSSFTNDVRFICPELGPGIYLLEINSHQRREVFKLIHH